MAATALYFYPILAVQLFLPACTSSSLNQLALYASLGVPEVWRYNGQRLQIYQLQHEGYVECDRSPTFPLLPATKVEEFLEQCQNLGVTAAVRQFRKWIKNQLQNPETGRSQG
jgi:Uma2 family endonuclease